MAVKESVIRFDSSGDKKSAGVAVSLENGERLLFDPDTARWRWRRILGMQMLEVEEKGAPAFHAPAGRVVCVNGPQVIFSNANWK